MNKFALIGEGIDYSHSPLIHNYLLKKYQLPGEYLIHNSTVLNQQVLTNFCAGNITIPHKQAAFEIAGSSNFSDHSINCFKQTANGYEFCSTDQYGIIDSIQKLHIKYIETRLHVIFGDGATSAMLVSCLINNFNVPADKIFVISRKTYNLKSRPKIIDTKYFKRHLKSNYILYNTSPLGQAKHADLSPFDQQTVAKALAIFDVTYNPTFNSLGKLAYQNRVKYIGGLNMLIVQALYAFKFWTGVDCTCDYGAIKRHIHFENSSKLIICAMPFAGKSTLYRRNRSTSCDLDLEIENYTGVANSTYINQYGIDKFRQIEAQVLATVLEKEQIKLVFLGGGTLTSDAAIELLSNQLVIYMVVSLKTLKKRFDKSRANIQSVATLEQLYYERDHHYRNISQFQIGARSIERMINEYLDY